MKNNASLLSGSLVLLALIVLAGGLCLSNTSGKAAYAMQSTKPATSNDLLLTPTVTPTGCGGSGPCFVTTTAATLIPGTTLLPGSQDDDASMPLTLPFPIQIGARSFIAAAVVTNGHLDFDDPEISEVNVCLPAPTVNTAIFADWEDLDMRVAECGPTCGIYTSLTGSAPNRVFNIEWRATLYGNFRPVNFEIRFHEDDPAEFDMVYGVMTEKGAAATVGLQYGGNVCQFECMTGGLVQGLAIGYRPPNCPTVTPTATRTSTPQPTCSISYSDVPPGSTFHEFVECLYCRGAIGGYPDGTFRPGSPATRGQMTKIVVLAFGIAIDTTGGPHFTDVPVGSTYYDYVETATNKQIVGGYPDGSFRPNAEVTRGQLSKIIVIAAVQAYNWTLLNPANGRFTDVPVGSTFYEYVETAVCHGIVGGYTDGTFRPGSNATRGQISKIACLAVRNAGVCTSP